MSLTAALASRARPTLALLLGTLAATIGLSAADGTASLAAALASTAFLVVAVTLTVAVFIVAPERTRTVGARSHAHRESLSRIPAPAHPDTAGRTRSRAPGAVAPAA